jgi:ATP-dependent exoDNAse (exonuclease V) alpha subunit
MQLEKEYITTLERIENYMGEWLLPPKKEFKEIGWLT